MTTTETGIPERFSLRGPHGLRYLYRGDDFEWLIVDGHPTTNDLADLMAAEELDVAFDVNPPRYTWARLDITSNSDGVLWACGIHCVPDDQPAEGLVPVTVMYLNEEV